MTGNRSVDKSLSVRALVVLVMLEVKCQVVSS